MTVVGQEKSRIILVLAWTTLRMFGNSIHKVLKFSNKPNVYLGMSENQLKRLRKGGYTYGAMLAWQMVFVLFMSSQLCLCSFKKPVCGVLQRGCTGSFLREAVECVETETIPGFMGPAEEIQNEDDGLKLMQRHCRDKEGETRQISQ